MLSNTWWRPHAPVERFLLLERVSEGSISSATVTPSPVMRGAPKALSSTTLRPFGPSVTFTALASMSTPRSRRSRASDENRTSLAQPSVRTPVSLVPSPGEGCLSAFACWKVILSIAPAFDVRFLHVGGVRPSIRKHCLEYFLESTPVPDVSIKHHELAALVADAGTDGDHLALLRLFLCGIWDDDAARSLFLRFNSTDNDAVVQGTECYGHAPGLILRARYA